VRQFLLDGIYSQLRDMLVQHLENDAAYAGALRQSVFQQVPNWFWYAPIMRVHPESVFPRSTRDVYFGNRIQGHPVDCFKWIEAMVDRVAVHVVQVE